MGISDISLTAGMRSNLTQLQSSVNLLGRTQSRLSSGKEVNSALDNAVNYFAAQGHMQRATDISSYKDGMAEAIQTIKSANTGIESITSMLETAKGVAESALQADKNSIDIELSGVSAGDTIDIGGSTFTMATCDGTAATQVEVGDSDSETAQNLANAINAATEGENQVMAVVDGTTVTIRAEANTAAITQGAGWAEDATGGNMTIGAVQDDRADLVDQYNSLMEQIDSMAGASGYRGVNLLKSDETIMTVKFEGGTLDVNGFEATASNLGANDSATVYDGEGTEWAVNDKIETDIKAINDAIGKLRNEASKLSSNMSIITTRQDFSNSMIGILQEGADGLTLADTNTEGANMLMLQTRQQLSTTALSMSAQAAQSVLRLF